MNTQLEAIQELIRINRDAMRELAKVAETTSADYVHIDNAMRVLGEQFHFLLQQKEELDTTVDMTEPKVNNGASGLCETSSDTHIIYNKEKRGRGAEKQYYLKDEQFKPAFIAQLKYIFTNHYSGSKQFCLPDGKKVKAHYFLACLYDLGVQLGITTSEAPVKDFCEIVKNAAAECTEATDFNTAYNTVQKALKLWNPFTGLNASQLYCTTVRFHQIEPSAVPDVHKAEYLEWQSLYSHVAKIYETTEQSVT